MMVEVSVVIPNYNSGDLIRRCVDSVLCQDLTEWEALIVDNHSVDESRLILDQITDPRIRILDIDNEGIIARSRNLGAAHATGRYIAFLDADDWWSRSKLSTAIRPLQKGECDVTYHRLRRSPRRIVRSTVGGPYRKSSGNLLLQGNRIPNSSVIMRTDDFFDVGMFDEDPTLVAAEDFDLWARLWERDRRFLFLPKVLGFYHETGTGMNVPSRRLASAAALLAKHGVDGVPRWLELAWLMNADGRDQNSPSWGNRQSRCGNFATPGDRLLFWLLRMRSQRASLGWEESR